MKEGKDMEHYQSQWYDERVHQWVDSWSFVAKPVTLEQAKEYLAKDQAYFYKRIPLRIVKVTTEVVLEATGLR